MARRGLPASFHSANAHSNTEDDIKGNAADYSSQESNRSGTKSGQTMPLTEEKRLDGNLSNNNDHNYLHKKFKKVASTVSAPSPESSQSTEISSLKANTETKTSTSNGRISVTYHSDKEKFKAIPENQNLTASPDSERNVQTSVYEKFRLGDVNNFDQAAGKTSFSEEFSNKTENLENDFIKDVQNGSGGRYVCPYCKLSCAKPSVLQKHIRAHTNERPYPCVPCGFAFKTKSNLYKHRRSRTHALRLQGADVVVTNEEELSAGSESDTSLPPTSVSDGGSDISVIRIENSRPSEFSSPELSNDRTTPTNGAQEDSKFKTIYKPKFRAFFKESEENNKKTFSPNADFLNEHISKIISDNEAIVDVIETPLQKKYNKIKKNAESKLLQANENVEIKTESAPLNLSKNVKDSENCFRKRALSETFSQTDFQKHPLNPEGSIIKDLLLKTKLNGIATIANEVEGIGTLYICPVCQISYRSADNLEIHRLYYCKGSTVNSTLPVKENKTSRQDLLFRSNSINVKLPETSSSSTKGYTSIKSASPRNYKPDNLVIIKPECNDVIAPLPSPGPLLGNTRLVDTRGPPEQTRNSENFKMKPIASPKRRLDNRSESFSPRLSENMSPRSMETYSYTKIRCIDASAASLRSIEDLQSHMRQNSTSLQMFGGEVKIVDHSGGTTTLRIEPSKSQLSPILTHLNLSPSKLANDPESSSIVVRSGLHSGGTIVHTPKAQTPRITISAAPNMPSAEIPLQNVPQFQFPPFNVITGYNPLTLPPLSPSSTTPTGASSILHGGKLIPHVPGIPGPNTPNLYVGTPNLHSKNNNQEVQNTSVELGTVQGNVASIYTQSRIGTNVKFESTRSIRSPNTRPNMLENPMSINIQSQDKKSVPFVRTKTVDELSATPRSVAFANVRTFSVRSEGVSLKRNAEGMPKTPVKDTLHSSPNKTKIGEGRSNLISSKSTEVRNCDNEIRNFNFENLITKAEIYNNQIISSSEVQKNTNAHEEPSVSQNERSETSYFQKNSNVNGAEDRKPKFLRPSTLPLKPGTFTPKRHHGITPNANTMPLVSPETPRPAKAYGQLYLNGNAYTYLGLKCSTKVFYCTINRPQPTYVPNQHFLSMYSNWQLLSDLTPDPLGLSASSAMSLYDSRHRPQTTVIAKMKTDLILTHSSQSNKYSKLTLATGERKSDDNSSQSEGSASKKELAGGFESNEEYTYIRGRGRGRYVCSECGIRCKKPSMLKKHIRTHTDVRPYTCTHCAFSFKTKGNLTKHMKSKAHYKKCCELGINPNEGNDIEGGEGAQCFGETDDESDSDGDEGNEGETESSDTEVGKSRLPEHEAAHCLLSLGAGAGAAATPGLLTSARPSTYPYSPPHPAPHDDRPEPEPTTSRDSDNEPMDLSRTELKPTAIPEIPTAGESSVLASLASNTAKLPQPQKQWSNGEPMLHAYLTERALLDSKIKQSQQLNSSLSKLRKCELDKTVFTEARNGKMGPSFVTSTCDTGVISSTQVKVEIPVSPDTSDLRNMKTIVSSENTISPPAVLANDSSSTIDNKKNRTEGNAENAKFVVSEYLKIARVSSSNESPPSQLDSPSESTKNLGVLALANNEEMNNTEQDAAKLPGSDHDPVARKVVIGAGGVAFKVTKGKEFDNGAPYSPGRLMEDGRRECDFCNKTFTKPSQLRLHLNIHYMERPFRCSACAVSFRTRGHLQKHERSGSHHNKVSMTSTFGAATSQNPRPFRCSDCNIAFRIHGHLAKHLRSKMHVMRLECLFKLPFGTFTEIERAGVSLTDIDTTDCASSLASLQVLARKLHDQDPSKLEYRDPPEPDPAPDPDSALHSATDN